MLTESLSCHLASRRPTINNDLLSPLLPIAVLLARVPPWGLPQHRPLGITGSHSIHQVDSGAQNAKPAGHRFSSWFHHFLAMESWINSSPALGFRFQTSGDDDSK